jgi:hypothetical protein
LGAAFHRGCAEERGKIENPDFSAIFAPQRLRD